MTWRTPIGPWHWYDLRSHAQAEFPYDPIGLASVLDVDPNDGRVLMHEFAGDTSHLTVLRRTGVEPAAGRGGPSFAAVSSRGELVRGSFATTALSRARVQPGTTVVLAGDRAGRVLVAEDSRLLLWDPAGRDVVELARLDKRIVRI